VVWPTETAPTKEKESVVAQEAAARRGRTIETVRRQLHELIESLSARDLDKVTAFAEFVKARRASRAYQRQEAGDAPVAESDPAASPEPLVAPATDEVVVTPPSGAVDEEATPSSRKRPAAR
jgi:hypothetical protein